MANITEEYLNYHEKFAKKYGKDKALVLMQVGSFYEAYSTRERGPDLQSISDIINVVCTRKDKSNSVISEKNPYMLGFPTISATKFINILVDNGKTLVVIDQVTPPPSPTRAITGIYSSGTYVEGVQKPDYNYVACIYLEEEVQKGKQNLLCSGMSAVDLTTGRVLVNECLSSLEDDKLSLDETIRFINSLMPREIILIYKKKDTNTHMKDFIISYLELETKNIHYHDTLDKKYSTLSYQNEYIKKIYGPSSSLEDLNLERNIYSVISMIYLFDFCYDHNEKVISSLNIPEVSDSKNERLVLGNNAVFQLNIVESDIFQTQMGTKFRSLFDVVNHTSTAIGRRFLKDRLLYPLVDSDELNKNYKYIESIKEDYPEIEKYLKGICDLERLNRKLSLNILQPYELAEMYASYGELIKLSEKIKEEFRTLKKIIPNKELSKKINDFMKHIESIYNIEELKKQNLTEITKNFFNRGVDKSIDDLESKMLSGHSFMDDLCVVLSTYIKDTKAVNKISVKHNERDGYYLSLTKLRAIQLKKKIEDLEEITVSDYKLDPKKLIFKENNNATKIVFPDLEKKSDEIEIIKNKLADKVRKLHGEQCSAISNKYRDVFNAYNYFTGFIDFIKSCAKTAKLYNYAKPIIREDESKEESKGESYLETKNLRHPIIERIIDYEYVPHDVCLGKDLKGMIIYGLNSSGKSSIMKAVGVSIVMAQAGMFVPADEFIYKPYKNLYTRITGNDNLFKGLSSFALEMVELKAILKRATNNSLIIGDEVCRGTEHISGNALVASAIINLAKSNSSFIFASHLHEIAEMERIKKLEHVKAFHLSVSYDPKLDTLIFDRKLKPGPGEAIYGITVASSIIHDKDFIDLAIEIKNEITKQDGSLISGKKSKYNAEMYIHECQLCHKKEVKGHVSNLETHHIHFQKDCEDGFVKKDGKKHIKKNSKSNLVVLCNECHDRLHKEEIELEGKMMTLKGTAVIEKSC